MNLIDYIKSISSPNTKTHVPLPNNQQQVRQLDRQVSSITEFTVVKSNPEDNRSHQLNFVRRLQRIVIASELLASVQGNKGDWMGGVWICVEKDLLDAFCTYMRTKNYTIEHFSYEGDSIESANHVDVHLTCPIDHSSVPAK